MDSQTRKTGHERGSGWAERHRLHMLHKGARHGSPTAERRCRRKGFGSTLEKETGWCQPLCRTYVTSQILVTR